jgi:putative NADPH-quinone reductase
VASQTAVTSTRSSIFMRSASIQCSDCRTTLNSKKALIISGTCFDERHYQQEGWGPTMYKSVGEWTFSNPGIANVQRVMFYGLNAADEATRNTHLETAYRLGKESLIVT